MAKKSNKTEHVLKLITKNDDESQDDDFFGIEKVEPAEEKVLKQEAKRKIEIQPEIEVNRNEQEEQKTQDEPKAMGKVLLYEGGPHDKAGSSYMEQHDHLVNIAEILTKEKIALVMEKMKVCNCPVCVNDVLALALNSLPTKYVTTDAGKQYFQLDIYKKQYETDVLAALTKACVRVKAAPRH